MSGRSSLNRVPSDQCEKAIFVEKDAACCVRLRKPRESILLTSDLSFARGKVRGLANCSPFGIMESGLAFVPSETRRDPSQSDPDFNPRDSKVYTSSTDSVQQFSRSKSYKAERFVKNQQNPTEFPQLPKHILGHHGGEHQLRYLAIFDCPGGAGYTSRPR